MEYETIGGEIKDTNRNKNILRFLKVGDRFSNKNGEGLWEVYGDRCVFSGASGSALRKCKNLNTGKIEHKLCRIEVIKR